MQHNLMILLIVVPLLNYSDQTPTSPSTSTFNQQKCFDSEQFAQLMAELKEATKYQKATYQLLLEQKKAAEKKAVADANAAQQKELHRQELLQKEKNRPWYEKALNVTSQILATYMIHSLWPTIKSQLTSRLAQIIIQECGGRLDRTMGDFPDRQWGPGMGYRPAEWLYKTPAERMEAHYRRTHSDITKVEEETNALKAEMMPFYMADTARKKHTEWTEYKARKKPTAS